MKPTGLPLLPATVSGAASDVRAWRLWLDAAVERVRREAVAECHTAEQQGARVKGAERVRDLLLSSLPEAP